MLSLLRSYFSRLQTTPTKAVTDALPPASISRVRTRAVCESTGKRVIAPSRLFFNTMPAGTLPCAYRVAPHACYQVLRGLTRECLHLSLAGPLRSSWKVRPGMARCMSRALASSFQTHVISINWSRDIITRVISETLLESNRLVSYLSHSLSSYRSQHPEVIS